MAARVGFACTLLAFFGFAAVGMAAAQAPPNVATMTPKSLAESGVRGIASRHGYAVASQPLSLYDLVDDPGETRNVAAEHPEVVARLRSLADEARADLGDAITGAKGSGTRPVGDIRPPLPAGVTRIPDLEFARVAEPVPISLLLDLYLPAADTETGPGRHKHPVVLWIHGGGWKHGSKEQCPLVWLAGEGVAVASINYRHSWQACWPAQIDDCRAAIAWLRREAATHGLDPGRIVVGGASAGGHLAALLGTAGTGAAPVHGDADPLVPLDQSTRLDDALDEAGVPSKLMVLPGAGHGGPAFDAAPVRAAIRALVGLSPEPATSSRRPTATAPGN